MIQNTMERASLQDREKSQMSIKVVYIAGPFRAFNSWDMEQNVREAEGYALRIWRLGETAVLCPHANTRFFQGVCSDDVWLQGDLEMLRRCDVVFMLPKWEQSEGAKEERREAIRCSIPVVYSLYGLKVWLTSLAVPAPSPVLAPPQTEL